MSTIKSLFLMLIIVLGMRGSYLLAQNRKGSKSNERIIKRIPASKRGVICPIFKKNKYPYQGIGIKLGDPIGITYKVYPHPKWALVGSAGFAASGLYSGYYKAVFKDYIPKTLTDNQSISYISHAVPIDWCFQTKALYQFHIDALFKGLQFYVGLGWQWRVTNLNYSYFFSEGDQNSGRQKILSFKTTRSTYGGLGILGFEYAQFSLPISAFLEVEAMVDAFLDPGRTNFQGSVGVRYIF